MLKCFQLFKGVDCRQASSALSILYFYYKAMLFNGLTFLIMKLKKEIKLIIVKMIFRHPEDPIVPV